MLKRILIEASGSSVSSYMITAIQESGHIAIASDISTDCAAFVLADEFITFPSKNDPNLWEKIEKLLIDNRVDVVIPSFDEMLLGWAEHKAQFLDEGIEILISDSETIKVFQDKWSTYEFFKANNIPCADSSLEPIYPFIKPREGRGSVGIFIEHEPILRANKFDSSCISQKILTGIEYTIDCLFDTFGNPIYIVPRKRLGVSNGKSTSGEIELNEMIRKGVMDIANLIKFIGPINVQCFLDDEKINFVEINPRIAGGMALGFAGTENWVPLFLDILTGETAFKPLQIQNHLKMYRTYQEVFTQ